jgi:hypothetical protein
MRWKLGPDGEWTQPQRDAQAALLEQMVGFERRALDEIAAGLAAVDRSASSGWGP